MKFRTLKPEEIKIRIGNIGEFGASLLLYTEARTIMDILDETVGPENWESDYKDVKGVLYGGIGVFCDGREVWKWDCGVESFSEASKGESSDALKRAGVKWGISRELYKGPKVNIKCGTSPKNNEKGYYISDNNDKTRLSKAFVKEIGYDDNRNITRLVIATKYWNPNRKEWITETLFTYHDNPAQTTQETPRNTTPANQAPAKGAKQEVKTSEPQKITQGGIDYLKTLIKETGTDENVTLGFYKVSKIEEMTEEQFEHCRKILEGRLSKTA